MNPLRMSVTRRTTFRLLIGTIAGLVVAPVSGLSQAFAVVTTGPAAATTDGPAVEPQGGAGLFDVDPDQGAVSQDPNVAVTGDIGALPEDVEV